MKFLSCLRVEINRVFRSPFSWVFIILSAASPLFGFTVFKINLEQTASTQMIINPLLTGTIGSGILFALFILFELDRVNKYKTSGLIDAAASPMVLHSARVIAVFSVSVITCALTLLVYYPYTMFSMDSFFDPALYFSSYLIFMLPAMGIGILLGAVFYQTFQRFDVSFVLVAACALANYSEFITGDFILRWINPLLPVFSDGFGNVKPLRIGLYNRLFLLLFLGGIWLISLLFTRKYGKGIFGSFGHNIKKIYLPVTGAALIAASVSLYQNQPFFNDAPLEVDWDALTDTGPELRYESVTADINPDFKRGTLCGKIAYILTNDTGEAVKKRMIINSGYQVYSMILNSEPIVYTDLKDDNFVIKHIEFEIPEGNNMELKVEYGGYPKIWGAYKTSYLGGSEIDRKNVELRTCSLIPSLNVHAAVMARIVLPEGFTLLSMENAVQDTIGNHDGTKTWILTNSYDSLEIYASNYARKIVNAQAMRADFYFHEKFLDIMERNSADEVLRDVFDYCTARYGPLNYLGNDNTLKLIQTTAFNFGGGAIPGISEMSETNFSIYSLSDPWKGAAGKEILAHEIIHQWWGLNRMIRESPECPEWTPEGLTVYSTYRLYKEKYGDEYGRQNYVEKWKKAVEEMSRNFYRRHPEYLERMPEDFAAQIRINETEVRKYSLMPLKILKAEELAGGEEALDAILIKLSKTNQFEQLTFQEFLDACGLTKEELSVE